MKKIDIRADYAYAYSGSDLYFQLYYTKAASGYASFSANYIPLTSGSPTNFKLASPTNPSINQFASIQEAALYYESDAETAIMAVIESEHPGVFEYGELVWGISQETKEAIESYVSQSSYTNEEAQDAIGSILTDTSTIDFTYNDGTPSITADVKDNSSTQKIVVSKAGSTTGTRKQVNFIDGSGVLITANDNSGSDRVDITISEVARSFATPSRSVVTATNATGFQISSTRDALVFYEGIFQTTTTIGGPADVSMVLETANSNSTNPADWTVVARQRNSNTVTLAIALQQVDVEPWNLSRIIPAGKWVRIRRIDTTGTVTGSINAEQQEVLL